MDPTNSKGSHQRVTQLLLLKHVHHILHLTPLPKETNHLLQWQVNLGDKLTILGPFPPARAGDSLAEDNAYSK